MQLAEEWQEEGRTTDSRESIQDWAARQLVGLKPGDESAEDFEVKFRALGSWAKIPYMLLTHYLKMAREQAARSSQRSSERVLSTPTRSDKVPTPSRDAARDGAERHPPPPPAAVYPRMAASPGAPRTPGAPEGRGAGTISTPAQSVSAVQALASASDQLRAADSEGKMQDLFDRLITVQESLANRVGPAGGPPVPAAREVDEERYTDKVNALAGIKFEKKIPVIKDNDLDLDRHIREFEAVLAMHSFGRRGIRPVDRWTMYKTSLQEGGIRFKIYMQEERVAMRTGRLPAEAQAVYEETIKKQKDRLRETDLKKRERIDSQFHDLNMKDSCSVSSWL